MRPQSVVSEIRTLVGPGEGHLNRAWALAWRAVRFLEHAEETARRARLAELDPTGPAPTGEPIRFVAAMCIRGAVPRPITGEAATVAAIGAAVALARNAADILYRECVAAAEKASDAVLNDPRRLEALRRTRSVTLARADEYLAAHAGDEDAARAAATDRQRARRAAHEAQILAEREARIARNRAARDRGILNRAARVVRKGA